MNHRKLRASSAIECSHPLAGFAHAYESVAGSAISRIRTDDVRMRASGYDAFPAGIILLDADGLIVSANAAWRNSTSKHVLLDSTAGVGDNYLWKCGAASAAASPEIGRAVAGIRSVLGRARSRFSLQYIDHACGIAKAYLLIVTPMYCDSEAAACVLHMELPEPGRSLEPLQQFALAMDSAPDAIYVVDRTTMRFTYVNTAACVLQRVGRDQLLLMGPQDALATPSWKLADDYDALIHSGAPCVPFETQFFAQDATFRWIEVRRQAVQIDRRWVIVTFAQDITVRKEAARRIAYLNRVHAMLSGINGLIVHAHTREDLFRRTCRLAIDKGGFRMAIIGLVNPDANTLTPVEFATDDREMLAAVKTIMELRGGTLTALSETAIRRKTAIVSNDTQNDLDLPARDTLSTFGIRSMAILPLLVADTVIGVLVLYAGERQFFHLEEVKLLTELTGDVAFAVDYIEKQDRLDYLALYDSLTGLANRTLFLERTAQYMRTAVRDGHSLALLLIDVERFQSINDCHGRLAGDLLIKSVSEWFTTHLTEASHISRVDADHFAVVLPEVNAAGDLARFLELALGQLAAHPFKVADATLRIAAKVGIALFPDDGTEVDVLFKHAEAALKKAKSGGHRYLFYTQRMTAAVADRLSVENRLRQALPNDEFELYYQPKMNLMSRDLTGVEALIRWHDPQAGLVHPGGFIHILEETGLIHDAGLWALRTAAADYSRWMRAGLLTPRIAVNVSSLQLLDPHFVDNVMRVLRAEPLAAAGLELELTETIIMEDIDRSRTALQAIRALGLKIAIDDFGTGFSSLSYLVRLPVDTIKVDRSFILELSNGAEGIALNSMIINLGHSLKLTVVGEGVETPEQEQALRSLGCDEIQGFLYAPPMPRGELESRFLACSRRRRA